MSPEVFQTIKSMSMKNLEVQIAVQCAPLLTGIKISNLLIVQKENARYVEEMFQGSEIFYSILCKTNKKTTFLLYRLNELSNYLSNKEVRRLLAVLGHKNHTLSELFSSFRIQYEAYMKCGGEFPHELGLLLGYPVEDVYGFIANKGQNFLYAGYWKVYANFSEKLKMFQRYNQAKEITIQLVSSGAGILEIVDMFGKNKLQQAAM
jgi:hypothetical protein